MWTNVVTSSQQAARYSLGYKDLKNPLNKHVIVCSRLAESADSKGNYNYINFHT